MAFIDTLTDNFDDNSLDAAKWATQVAGTSTIQESDGKIIITPQANGSYYNYLYGQANYDMTGKRVYVQLKQMSGPNTFIGLMMWLSTGNYIEIVVDDGLIKASKQIASVWSDLATLTYNPDDMRYIALRESGGTTYYEYSRNGKTWVTLYSVANPVAVTSLNPNLECSNNDSSSAPGAAWFDNFNIVDNSIPGNMYRRVSVGNGISTNDGVT